MKTLSTLRGCVLLVLAGLASAPPVHAAFEPVKTELVRGGGKPQALSVDVTGVDDLYLVVTFGPDDYDSDQAIWASPTLLNAAGERLDLTTIEPVNVQVGWGKLFVNRNHRGQPLPFPQKISEKGFWAHGPSQLHFKLDGKYTRFTAEVGIDKGAGTRGSVEFVVTNVAPKMPPPSAYKRRNEGPPQKAVTANLLPAEKSPHEFNAAAAGKLLERGVKELVFVRRFTLNANHVYTEYVNSRWTPGGGLCVLNLETGQVREVVPELTEGVVNRFDISCDGSKIVFDYKKSALEGYRIYEVALDGSKLRQLTFPTDQEEEFALKYGTGSYHHGTDDLHPCYLPDGGIVFSSTRCQYSVLCDSSDNFTTKVLHRMDGNGGNLRPLSNSPVSEASPAMLPDGRILYHRWEYVDKAAGNLKCLWSMNPDGTNSAEVYGNTITFPETMIYARPIPGASNKIVMLGASHCCPNNAMGAVIVIDTSDDIRAIETMRFVTPDIHALAHNGFHFSDGKGGWAYDKTGAQGRLFKDPYPISEDLFLAARKPKGPDWDDPAAYSLVLLDGEGTDVPLYRDEAISCWHPYPVQTRAVPPVVASVPDRNLAEEGKALCVVTDVYRGMSGVERGSIKYLRILEEVPRPWAARKEWFREDRDGMAHTAVGDDILGLKAQHGIVPVEADGSAHFTVPAMRNIYLQALDENLLAVQTERTYVHYMPGERRSCIGCHETPNQDIPAPNAAPLALSRPPSAPSPQPGEASGKKLFDYERQIQPIWGRHCVSCHGEAEPAGGLNLTSAPDGVYNTSYLSLVKLSQGPSQLLGNRKPRNEDIGSAGIEYTPAWSLGALTSPLAALFSGGKITLREPQLQAYVDSQREAHQEVKLSDAEFLQVTNWLDINCQYYPSYWGRANAKFQGHPNYRPAVTFEEAIQRTVPDRIRAGEETAAGAGSTK